MDEILDVHQDIRRASALPPAVYLQPEWFERMKERVFVRSWQLVGDGAAVAMPGACLPLFMLEDYLDEPLVFVRDDDGVLHCVSNVCTHRGNLVCQTAGVRTGLRCAYHGRRFGLDGRFQSMPEFAGVEGFPGPQDDLPRVPCAQWGRFLFASPDPAFPFASLVAELDARVGWLPTQDAVFDPTRSKDYVVLANWALYCDNYLEGFHIPFVHPSLAAGLEFGAYRTELFPFSSLQVGIARAGESAFDLPRSSPDFGQRVGGYYFWLFPNTLLNFYPWGLSANVVKPLGPARTKVSFMTWVWDASKLDQGAGADLDRVEMEDEFVVESAQRGIRSRFYGRSRYSPTQEQGVHHFHRLLAGFLKGDAEALSGGGDNRSA
jgi:choline monooxygenase